MANALPTKTSGLRRNGGLEFKKLRTGRLTIIFLPAAKEKRTKRTEELTMEKRIQFRRQKRSELETQFWLRTFAFMIDTFIIRLIFIPILVSGISLLPINLNSELNDKSSDIFLYSVKINTTILSGLYLTTFILYSALMESSRLQGSIGKWFLRYRVYDTDFNKISFKKALARNALKIISIASIIGIFTIDMTHKRQGLHDLIMRTILVRR